MIQRTFKLSMTLIKDCKELLLNIYYIVTHTHTLEEILLCHVVDFVGTIGYCASAEQGLSGVQGGTFAPTLLKMFTPP